MVLNIAKELKILKQMTVGELREKYQEVFGEESHSRNKPYLIRRIAWRMQANEYGGLSQRARDRAHKLADVRDLRLTAPRNSMLAQMFDTGQRVATHRVAGRRDARLPLPGTLLTREYKGRMVKVTVLESGFEYDGDYYRSLSAVAQAVTGARWNGFLFFKLSKRGKKK